MSDSQATPADPGTPDTPASGSPDPAPTSPATSRKPTTDPLRGSRTSGLWVSVALSGLVLVLLIVFIAQNTDPVRVSFFGWDGETPLAVALLIATAAGLFLATVAGSLRILQLRRRVRREKH